MKTYRVGRLEIHEFFEEVEADDPIDAAQKVLDGQGTPVDADEGTYVESCEERGIAIDQLLREFPELNNKSALKRLDKFVVGDFIPSIRTVEEI